MARHRVAQPPELRAEGFTVDEETARAAAELEKWTTRKPKKKNGFSDAQLRKADRELEDILESRDWSTATAKHFLALFCRLYAQVYGVAPIMATNERLQAVQRLGGFLKNRFDSDPTALAFYFRWVWKEEARKESWCKEQGIQRSGSLGWRVMITNELLSKYLVVRMREKGNGK